MPRTPRYDWPGARHHIMNRGARRERIYLDDDDGRLFLGLLAQTAQRHDLPVHGYALMPNHYHILVVSRHGNLSAAMRDLNRAYTQAFNRRHGLDGPLFRGRFRNRVAVDRHYWAHLPFYLHHNPVAAGICADPADYPWTSYRAYAGIDPPPAWLQMDELLDEHGGTVGYLRYHALHAQGLGRLPEGWNPAHLWAPYTTDRNPGSDLGDPTIETRAGYDALAEVVSVTGLARERLLASVRGRKGNPARWVAVWWLVYRAGVAPRDLARDLAVPRSTISAMLTRVERERATGSQAGRWADELVERSGQRFPVFRPPNPYAQEKKVTGKT